MKSSKLNAKRVAVFFIHGIQTREHTFADRLIEELDRTVGEKTAKSTLFQPVFWADVVRGRSQQYISQAIAVSRLPITSHRRLVIEGLGDAAAYQKTRNREHSAYFEIHERMSTRISEAPKFCRENALIILIGHSFGAHIASSYVWDINRLKQLSDSELDEWDDAEEAAWAKRLRHLPPFSRLDTLAGFVTMGSSLPLFTFTFGGDRVYPITSYPEERRVPAFPGSGLSPRVKEVAVWLNFYSSADILGFPVKPLSSHYLNDPRIKDIRVRSEGKIRAFMLPRVLNAAAAHRGYWTDRTVRSGIASLIKSTVAAHTAGCDDLERPSAEYL